MYSLKICFIIFLITLTIYSPQVSAEVNSLQHDQIHDLSPFSVALDVLQQQIKCSVDTTFLKQIWEAGLESTNIIKPSLRSYQFESIDLLRRAMTHASYSEENNKALSILGAKVMETSVSLGSLVKNMDISSKELNRQVSEICNVDSSCASDGMRLGLQKIVRVSSKTSSSTPAVVCGAFRAMFGAIAVDMNSTDDAGSVFWEVHDSYSGRAFEQ